MDKKIHSVMMLTLLLIGMLTLMLQLVTGSSIPTVYVDPPSIVDSTLTPGNSFTVDIEILDAVDLYAWQVCMSWDMAVLNATEIVFGNFLAGQPEGSLGASRIVNEEGWLVVAEITRGMYPGVDGDAWLCSITFLVKTSGETVMDIAGTVYPPQFLTFYVNSLLVTIGDDPGELIKENGYFNNLPSSTIHELKTEIEELGSEGDIDNHGIVNSLIAKLNVAQKLVDSGKIDQAKTVLEAFIQQVQNLSDIHITPDAADVLIESAEYILSHL